MHLQIIHRKAKEEKEVTKAVAKVVVKVVVKEERVARVAREVMWYHHLNLPLA